MSRMAARMLVIFLLLGMQNLGTILADHENQIVKVDDQNQNGTNTNTNDGETKALTKKIMCYYHPEKGVYLNAVRISALCTHVIIGFAHINNDSLLEHTVLNQGSINLSEWSISSGFYFAKDSSWKTLKKDLKVLISVGGPYYDQQALMRMISNDESRRAFIRSVIHLLKNSNFDGLNFYPDYPSAKCQENLQVDIQSLTLLFKALREAFEPYGFELSAALPANLMFHKQSVIDSYDLVNMVSYLDHVHLMAYDIYCNQENYNIHSAPMYLNKTTHITSLNDSIQKWLKLDIPRSKLILCIYSWWRYNTIKNATMLCQKPSTSENHEQMYPTQENQLISYKTICSLKKYRSWSYRWLEEQEMPILFKVWKTCSPFEKDWYFFEDARSVGQKAKYLNDFEMGGAALFTINGDDSSGVCGQGHYPLLEVLKIYLNSDSSGQFSIANVLSDDTE